MTVLALSSQTPFSSGGLAQLLQALPNLLFLRIEVGKHERVKIEDLKLEDDAYLEQLQNEIPYYLDLIAEKDKEKDIAFKHANLQILKIDSQTFSSGQKQMLKTLLPNAYLDIQITEIQDEHDRLRDRITSIFQGSVFFSPT